MPRHLLSVEIMTSLRHRVLYLRDWSLVHATKRGKLRFDGDRVLRQVRRQVVELPGKRVAESSNGAQDHHQYNRHTHCPWKTEAFQEGRGPAEQECQERCQHQ